MWNARVDESQDGIKIARRNINNLRYADDTTMMELKSLLRRVEEESEKAGLKFNIQNTKIMACGPMTSWQIEGGKLETAIGFLFLASKITVYSDWSMKLKDACSLEEKLDSTNDKSRQHIKKQRHHIANKGPYFQSYGFFF